MATAFFNGVRLPVLPEYDAAAYPCAAIVNVGDTVGGTLICSAAPMICGTLTATGGTGLVSPTDGNEFLSFIRTAASGMEWEESLPGAFDAGEGVGGVVPVWASYHVLTAGGEVYLAASGPVPAAGLRYAVSDGDLSALAKVIREKGKTEDALEFPDGFVSAVKAMETEPAAVTSIDYSALSSGTFTERLETGQTVNYTVSLDANGRVSTVTNGEHTVTVTWG